MSKCVQNNTVYRGDTPLFSHIKVYLLSPCISAKSQLQSWQNYHKVGSLLKSFLVQLSVEIVSSPCLSSFYFLLSQFVALATQHQCNIMVSVPFICAGNFPPYVNYIYTGRMSRFFATYEQGQTSFQFQFQFPKCRLYFNITVYNQNQNYFWTVFDTNIYSNVLISA